MSALMRRHLLLRNLAAGEFFEDFLVFAVAAILGFRLVLHLTGYPSLGGETLHIAHMLPGGLLMLAALLLLFGYLGSGVKRLAAVIGGAGFGTFIDELGKFVTRDNDYFFKPTAALIYLVFILTWLVFRATRRRPLTREESVANALELLTEAMRHDLDPDEKARALELVREGDPADAAIRALEEAIARIGALESPNPGPFTRFKLRLRTLYGRLVSYPWFAGALITFFVAYAVVTLARAAIAVRALVPAVAVLIVTLLVAVAAVRAHRGRRLSLAFPLYALAGAVLVAGTVFASRWVAFPALSFFEGGEILASAVPGLLVVLGIWRLGRSRLAAYEMFQRAVLFQIFVVEFFSFYHAEFVAAAGLLVHLLVFATLRYVIHRESGRPEPAPT
jgi:hypothetical protein